MGPGAVWWGGETAALWAQRWPRPSPGDTGMGLAATGLWGLTDTLTVKNSRPTWDSGLPSTQEQDTPAWEAELSRTAARSNYCSAFGVWIREVYQKVVRGHQLSCLLCAGALQRPFPPTSPLWVWFQALPSPGQQLIPLAAEGPQRLLFQDMVFLRRGPLDTKKLLRAKGMEL